MCVISHEYVYDKNNVWAPHTPPRGALSGIKATESQRTAERPKYSSITPLLIVSQVSYVVV